MGLFFNKRRRRSSRSRSLPLFRWFGPGLTVAGILTAGFAVLTGRINLPSLDQYRGETASLSLQPISIRDAGEKTADRIRIATFNIRQFADAKSNNMPVMQRIAEIVSLVDVIAIQEVMAGGRPVDVLLQILNQNTTAGRYKAAVSPAIGRTSHKEHYVYIWDSSRIAIVPDSSYVIQDGQPGAGDDLMHREPFVASFQVRTSPTQQNAPFRFTLINVHTDPDDVSGALNELDVLDDVFNSVRSYEYQLNGETDYILLGDLNVPVKGLSELGAIPNVISLAGSETTNIIRTKTLDHILIDQSQTRSWIPGRAAVMDLANEFGMTQEEVAQVSDHLPVFAEFSVYEGSPTGAASTVARGDSTSVR